MVNFPTQKKIKIKRKTESPAAVCEMCGSSVEKAETVTNPIGKKNTQFCLINADYTFVHASRTDSHNPTDKI